MNYIITAILLIACNFLKASVNELTDYRLVIVRDTNRSFDPAQDITKASKEEKLQKEVSRIFTDAVLKSLNPLYGQCEKFNSNMLLSLMTNANIARSHLLNELKKIDVTSDINYVAYLIPWKQDHRDLFYGNEKISAKPTGSINILNVTPEHPEFFAAVSKEMGLLNTKLARESDLLVYLIGFKYHLQLNKNFKNLFISVLVGLNEQEIKLTEPIKNEEVKISKIVIPNKETVAKIDFQISVDGSTTPPPRMILNFGEFDKFEESSLSSIGQFILKKESVHTSAPRLEGEYIAIKKLTKVLDFIPGVNGLGINFNIEHLNFNLNTVKVDNLNLLLSPGLRMGETNKVIGSISKNEVNTKFKDEINKNISKSIEDGATKLEKSVLQIFESRAK